MRVTVLRLGLAIHAMESSWMATPVAPEPLARGSTTTGFTHSPVHRPALRTTATESAGPSGTITVVPRPAAVVGTPVVRSEEHTSELQSHSDLVCRLLLEKKKQKTVEL